jgi:cytochrome c oxidase subunit 2
MTPSAAPSGRSHGGAGSRRARAVACGFVPALLGAGYGPHNALDPAGPQAQRIATLWWLFFWVCAVVYALVLIYLFAPSLRRRRGTRGGASPAPEPAADPPVINPEPGAERLRGAVVGTAVAVTTVVLFILLVADMVTGRGIHTIPDPNPLTVKLVGHQWWWEVQYPDVVPVNIINDANEVHIPVGRPVKFELSSSDVIHSFWIPNLHGKKDMVPGHPIGTWLQADRPGTYVGQCGEFCGHQHANMRLAVIAHDEKEFKEWVAARRQPPTPPQTEAQKKGQQVFLASTCIMCHTVQGTNAGARLGPDLTHVGSRWAIGAGAIPNAPGHIAGWVLDPQKIKPGVRMPANPLRPEDLRALLEYLQSLK